jgi:phosphatidylserine/phosphatidylglycerophosphate/cardiolipin synthase-like enzyme
VQALLRGDAASALLRLFEQRWYAAVGQDIALEPLPRSALTQLDFTSLDPSAILPLRASRVSLARTMPASSGQPPRYEVRAALCAALQAAERIIYIETQYFTSRTVRSALLERLRNPSRSKLQILALMPRGADNSKEKFALGDLQSATLSDLQEAGDACGHQLRFLCSSVAGEDCDAITFIHSKLLIVDDEVLCVGSANMTERSLTLDSELCLFWRAEPGSALAHDIAEVRASLLAEHSGVPVTELREVAGLTERVDADIARGLSRLRVSHFERVSISPIKQAIFDPSAADAAAVPVVEEPR